MFCILSRNISQKILTFGITLLLFLSFSISSHADEGNSRETMVNNLSLTSTQVASPELDAYLDEVMSTIITDDMSTYTKLQVCYDYIISNTTYGSHLRYMGNTIKGITCTSIYNAYGEVAGYGAATLSSGKGLCNGYATAWMLMAEKVGVQSTLARGYTRRAGGGYAYHEWAEVTIDGVAYTVDPQLQQSLRKSGKDPYSVFFVSYADQVGRYKKNA